MTKPNQPLTLRLPFAMVDRHLRLEQILAADPSRSWAQSQPLVARFALTRPEKQFARRLLERKRNIWLFRCSQRGYCGDFIVVDMSAGRPELRPVVVIELKSGVRPTIGGGAASLQLRKAGAAVAELAKAGNVIAKDTPITLVCGDYQLVLEWIEAGMLIR
jgi:hypothetical protein